MWSLGSLRSEFIILRVVWKGLCAEYTLLKKTGEIMALDGIFLRHIKNEIENEALGARVSQIYQPNRDELVFTLRTFGGNKKLLLSARANSPRINFCTTTPENPAQPPMFCMLLARWTATECFFSTSSV